MSFGPDKGSLVGTSEEAACWSSLRRSSCGRPPSSGGKFRRFRGERGGGGGQRILNIIERNTTCPRP